MAVDFPDQLREAQAAIAIAKVATRTGRPR
jgi:hypothetical protein